MLTLVHGGTEAAMHAALWDAVRAGLVFRLGGQPTVSCTTGSRRRPTRSSRGDAGHVASAYRPRLLAAHDASEELDENIFDIVNQFDRGAALITTEDGARQVAELNLHAGKAR